MWNTLSYIKEIIIWSLPFYALHIYLEKIYHISLGQLLIWWAKNFTSTESSTAITVSFIFIFLLFCLPTTSLINSFYLSLFGEKQTLVYLGNHSQNNSMYYKQSDITKHTLEGYNIDKSYSFSFSELNKVKYFIKDPGTNEIVGQKNKRLHLTAILSTFFFMMFFMIPVLGVIHAFAYPMYIDINGNSAHFHGEAMQAFEAVLLDFKITKGMSVFILFGGLLLAIYFGGQVPKEKDSLSVTPLPTNIKEGATINALPIEINIVYEKLTNDDGTTSSYDSGFRTVIFRFDKGFSPAVYLALNFDTNIYSKLENIITESISTQTTMMLLIDENLGVRPEYKLELN